MLKKEEQDMDKPNYDLSNFQNSFEKVKGRIHVLERSVPVEVQMEYFRASKRMRRTRDENNRASDEECEQWYAELCGTADTFLPLSIEERRQLLLQLANSRNPKAFKCLKQYVENDPDPATLDWAYLALMDIQIALESELSEEKQIYIATGLGGKGEKLRFYVLMVSKGRKPFEEYQRNIIEREFGYYFPKVDCEIEELHISVDYVELLLLMPIRSNIQQILTKIIIDCNEYGDFLSTVYTITNVEKFTQAEIEEVLERHENLETGD